jgi:putative heme degradation protein
MSRLEKLLLRVRKELADHPGSIVQDVARKFTIPEGSILEALRDGIVQKVRREQRASFLRALSLCGPRRFQVRNDWATCEISGDGAALEIREADLIFVANDRRLQVARKAIESVYFVEEAQTRTIRFFNRRGRFIFQVVWDGAVALFEEMRRQHCG